MGREGAVSAPQAKAWPPRTIFLAPALVKSLTNRQLNRETDRDRQTKAG